MREYAPGGTVGTVYVSEPFAPEIIVCWLTTALLFTSWTTTLTLDWGVATFCPRSVESVVIGTVLPSVSIEGMVVDTDI